MGVNFDSSRIHLLAGDLGRVPERATKGIADVVEDVAKRGNSKAAQYARASAGEHGKHYHKAFTAERVSMMTWEYGPLSAMPQGGMSFEFGSRNQPPHLDLAKSADLLAARFRAEVAHEIDRLFW